MIVFGSDVSTSDIRQMWKTVFEDTEEYMDLYFARKYIPENTLVYLDTGKPVASLQMLPYTITFYGLEVHFYYLIGLCTIQEYRRKGYMNQLINYSHEVMAQRGIPLSILVPAEDYLFDFYERFDYEKVFEKGSSPILINDIVKGANTIHDKYLAFCEWQSKDFWVQKNIEDFKTILDEYYLDSVPPRTNLAAMARIIDAHYLLDVFAKRYKKHGFVIQVDTNKFKIKDGVCLLTEDDSIDLNVNHRMLCRLLFGFNLEELNETFSRYFSPHHPVINLMLE